MSSPYDNRGTSRRRGVITYWVPLAITVAVATAGLAAWAWSQRSEDDEDDHEGLDYEDAAAAGAGAATGAGAAVGGGGTGPHAGYQNQNPDYYRDDGHYGGAGGGGGPGPDLGPGVSGRDGGHDVHTTSVDVHAPPSWSNRVSGALRRTPSPHQMLSSAGKTVSASVAAAGAAVGNALQSIREEDKAGAYADHETWSEEADAKKERREKDGSAGGSKKRKVVAIVVSADTDVNEPDQDGFEHASILSHIPKNIDFSKVKLYILIFSPGLKDSALDPTGNLPPPSLSSSISNIGHDQAQIGPDGKSPVLKPSSANPAFNAVYSQALALVEKETNVLPFSSANGHVHILRHLKPEIVYLQESLSGDENGSAVAQLQTWLRYDVVLIVGAESGHGGLADSESEAEANKASAEKWWQRPDRVGRGRGIVVVDGMRVSDDWAKRVAGNE